MHTVLYYDDDARLLDLVGDFVAAGLDGGERVVVIVRASRIQALERLLHPRLDLLAAVDSGRLLLLEADRTLARFMVDGSPDVGLFLANVASQVAGPDPGSTRVRAFGEMVAVLWDEGNVTGAIELESMWNDLFSPEPFTLMCAYPMSALTGSSLLDIDRVCHLHTAVQAPAGYVSGMAASSSSLDRPDVRTAVFLPLVESVPATRGFVADVLRSWKLTELQWEAVLVASELANNAVRHGASPFRVLVSRTRRGIRIGIQDVAPGRPLPRSAAPHDVDGRGMTIVSALAVGWGCEQLTDGKFTWAELEPAGA
jgi:anti-sigma regulatory factor (Ser/Thr protein kinase)